MSPVAPCCRTAGTTDFAAQVTCEALAPTRSPLLPSSEASSREHPAPSPSLRHGWDPRRRPPPGLYPLPDSRAHRPQSAQSLSALDFPATFRRSTRPDHRARSTVPRIMLPQAVGPEHDSERRLRRVYACLSCPSPIKFTNGDGTDRVPPSPLLGSPLCSNAGASPTMKMRGFSRVEYCS